MSMISEQIKRLREKADTFERSGSAVDGIVKEFRQAADTIEELSAKLHNANMERSSAYYNDGWIPVSERLPEDGEGVLVYAERNAYGENGKYRKKVIDIGWQVDGHWHIDGCNGVVGIAWMPLPTPYKQEVEE